MQKIPLGFVKKHIHENKETATLRYSNKLWAVKIIWSSSYNHAASFSAGWPAFARETRLRSGDVCVFELIDENDTVFNVSTFDSAGKYLILLLIEMNTVSVALGSLARPIWN